MAGDRERDDVFRVANELKWRVDPKVNKKGYTKIKCPCGLHMFWLHATPSSPTYYLDKIKWMRRVCSKPADRSPKKRAEPPPSRKVPPGKPPQRRPRQRRT